MADPAPTVSAREITVDGLRSRLLEAGPADASEAVVFVHGNPNSADEWSSLMASTGEFARAIALDMPGFGKADRPRELAYPVEGYVRFLAGALEQLGISRVHLVLHDYGGPWGLGWAATHPDAFASAVLINTGVLIGFEMHKVGRLWGKPVVGEALMALTTRSAFRRSLRKANPDSLPDAFIDAMYDDYDRGTRRTVLQLYRNRTDDELLERVAEMFHGLDRPALVLWGAKDEFVPLHHAEQQKRAFPSAQVVVLEDSGHWPFADDPEGAARAVLPFLRGQVGGVGS